MLETYVSWLTRWHRHVILVQLLLALVLGTGALKLTLSDDFRVYFKQDNPRLLALDHLENDFNTQDTVYFLVVPDSQNIFDSKTLTVVSDLTEDGWLLPHAQRVSSLANFQYSYAKGDDIFAHPLIAPGEAIDEEKVRRIALSEPTLINNIVAESSLVTGVSVSVTLPDHLNETAGAETIKAARELRDRYQEENPGIRILLAGSLTTNVILAEAVLADIKTLITLSFAIIGAGLWILLRSLAGVVATLLLVALSVLATLGFFGLLGYTVTPVAGFAPSIIMTIAIADSVHILANFFYHFRLSNNKIAAIHESIRINAQPIFVTSITTIIGVLTLNFSESPPYQALGNMVAVGVLLAFAFSLSLLPCILMWWPLKQPESNFQAQQHPMEKLGRWVVSKRKQLLFGFGALILAVSIFIPNNELTEKWHEYFDTSFEYRQAIDLVDQHLSGIDGLVYKLDSGIQDEVYDPDYLRSVEAFANWFRQQPEVVHVNAITDTLKRLNMNMHGDDPRWYNLPDRRDLAAQYLLLYEIQLPPGLGIDTAINLERSATRMGVTLRKTGSSQLLQVEQRAQEWLASHHHKFVQPQASGLDVVFAHLNTSNIRSLLLGTVLALVLISGVLIIMLRSVRLGLISLVPNLVPAAMAYGLWGLFVGHINVALSVVIAMSLGIVVDDTVHFLSKYLRARREKNLNTEDGIVYAFRTVGVALTITTVILVCGFAVLSASHFTPTRETGTLLAMTLGLALIVDFFFLPPLLLAVDRSFEFLDPDHDTSK